MKDAKGHGSEPHGGAAHQSGVADALNPQRPLSGPATDDAKFKSFLAGAQDKVNQYYAANFANAPHMKPPTLEASEGGRYVRIAAVERTPDGTINSRSAHTFVDKTTGDVLKPASWKTPAKGVRGNVHDEHNGLGRMTHFGPAYNR